MGNGQATTSSMPNTERIVFLDVDGVLNKPRQYHIDTELVHVLKDIIVATNAAIVLSSNWRRREETRREFRDALVSEGMPPSFFLSCTRVLGTDIRTDEIIRWLQENTDFNENNLQDIAIFNKESLMPQGFYNCYHLPSNSCLLEKRIHVTQWVVLDDDINGIHKGDNASHIMNRFIHVNAETGLTREDTARAIKILLSVNQQEEA